MEESEISSAAPTDANASNADSSVNISNIFHDDSESKKVIVLQSPILEDENSIQVQGELPNLMDAVSQPGDVTDEQNVQVTTEITYETNNQSVESTETVSAVEETNNVLNESNNIEVSEENMEVTEGNNMEVTEVNNMEVTEYVPQVITDQNIPEGQELIYLNPDDIKDQNIQFIDVSETQEMVTAYQGNVPTDAVAQAFQDAVADTELPIVKQEDESIPVPSPRKPKPNQLVQKDDPRTRFLCPVCEKSFRQKHLLLCHIKLHDGRPKNNSVYMSNCTTCGGNVRLTSEQARLLQERGTEDARIICSTCKILGHDVIQQNKAVPIELKPAFNFACDMCGCDIKLTDDQLQLVERKGAENIRIICAPCSTKDVEPEETPSNDVGDIKCNVCRRTIVHSSRDTINRTTPTCAECQAKSGDAIADRNINPVDDTFTSNCSMCHKELFFAERPAREVKVVCESCKNKKLLSKLQAAQPVAESPVKPVESLAVMYKCNTCFCNMQLSVEQKELLRVRGVSGTKIICASCHAKETAKPASAKKPRLTSRTYQCDICLLDLSMDYTPKEDDDIICNTCRRAEEKEQNKNKAGPKRLSNDTKAPSPSSINRCCTCNKALPLSRAQLQKLMQKGNRARVKCLACNRKTEEELKKTKRVIKTEEGVDYRCEICSISFGHRFDDFTEHFSRVHAPESDFDRSGKGFKSKKTLILCPICDAAFTDRVNLKMHMNTHKPVEQRRSSMPPKPCPLCCKLFDQIQMYAHYKKVHKIDITTLHYTFKSSEELRDWKTNQEVANDLKFLVGEPRAAVLRGRSGTVVTLRCQYAVRKVEGNKYSRVLCPAMMKVHERQCGRFDVEYVETHVGHGDLNNLPEEDQQLILEMVKGGSKVEEIIDELFKHYNDPESEDLLRSVTGLKSLNMMAVRKELGLETGVREDTRSGDEDYITDPDFEGNVLRYVDLPESLSWLNEDELAENGECPESEMEQQIQPEAIVDILDTGEGYQLRFQSPSHASKDGLSSKKIEVLRRLTEMLNKCSCDEHLEIIDAYFDPCEQTLNEISSGRSVEIVEDDGSPGDEKLPTNEEPVTAASPERSKNEPLEKDTT